MDSEPSCRQKHTFSREVLSNRDRCILSHYLLSLLALGHYWQQASPSIYHTTNCSLAQKKKKRGRERIDIDEKNYTTLHYGILSHTPEYMRLVGNRWLTPTRKNTQKLKCTKNEPSKRNVTARLMTTTNASWCFDGCFQAKPLDWPIGKHIL